MPGGSFEAGMGGQIEGILQGVGDVLVHHCACNMRCHEITAEPILCGMLQAKSRADIGLKGDF